MLTRMVVIFSAVTLALSLPLFAQTTAPAANSTALTGEVTGTDVYVRGGPSLDEDRCAKIHRPAKVTVVETKDGWLKIQPVAGCFSVIAKQYVQADAAGKTGTVTGDNVWLRAGGDLCRMDKVGSFSSLQTRLNKGAQVTILGQAGDYYKITPPPGCCFYISAEFVSVAGKPPVAREKTDDTGTVEVTGVRHTGTTTKPAHTEVAKASAVDGDREAFDLAEKELKAEFAKPGDQRDYKALLAKYQAVKTGDDEYLQKAVDYRVTYLQGLVDAAKDAKEVEELVKGAQRGVRDTHTKLEEIKVKEATTPPTTAYAADGILMPSGLFPGNAVTPKRWVVRDPDTNRVTAYVQCTSDEDALSDLKAAVNKHVGITGSTQYDKDLGLYIVEAKTVRVLGEKGGDTVAPETKPAPKATEDTPAVKPEVTPATKPAVKPETATTKPAADDRPTFDTETQPAAPDKLPAVKAATTAPAKAPATQESDEL